MSTHPNIAANVVANITAKDMANITAKDIANILGVGTDAVRMKYKRMFPTRPFDATEPLPREISGRLLADGRKKAAANKPANKPVTATPVTIPPAKKPSAPEFNLRRAMLIFLLVAPTAASVTNMYHVTGEITAEPITAALYTIVLSVTALGFTLAGTSSWLTAILSFLLIGYEAFCNLSRLYYGLMGGVCGNPTRFLGTVTDIFHSGSHGTAIAIAGFSAAMLAAVQYTAIFEINK